MHGHASAGEAVHAWIKVRPLQSRTRCRRKEAGGPPGLDRTRKPTPEISSLLTLSRSLLRRILGLFRNEGEDPSPLGLRSATFHLELALHALRDGGEGQPQTSSAGAGKTRTDLARRPMRKPHHGPGSGEPASVLDTGGYVGLSGCSSVISLPEVVGMLQVHEKSGLLRVVTKTETLFMGFEKGDLVHAYSSDSPPSLRLGEILVSQDAIDRERLNAFLARHSTDHGKFGEALEREELVTKQALREAIEYQVQQLFLRAQESDAFYAFTPGEPEKWGYLVRFGVVRLLLESARLQDEAMANPLSRVQVHR